MNKATILEICGRIKSSPKPEQSKHARELIAAANAMGDKLTDELVNEITAALEPVSDLTDVRANLLTDLNESLRSEKDHEKRRGILTAMMRLRNEIKQAAN